MNLLILYAISTIALSFLCSILEAVLLSVNPTFLKIKINEGNKYAENLQKMKDNIDEPLIIILTLNTLNILFLINSKWCIPLTVLLFYVYFKLSSLNKREKTKLFLTWLTFSILTLFGESFVIKLNKFSSLNYANTDLYNVPSWLFSAYANMVLYILFTNEYYDYILD